MVRAGQGRRIRKVAIGYPPMNSEKGVPLVSQNRQFQWFNKPTYIYPVIPAYAATVLRDAGYEVAWLDAVAEQWSLQEYLGELDSFQPDLIAVEVKTPVVKKVWQRFEELRDHFPDTVLVLMGDHITALPDESFGHCPVDFCITGGDYDFSLLNLVRHLDQGEELEPGVHWRADGVEAGVENNGAFTLKHDLNVLPFIDRELTRWRLYAHANGNFKCTPGTYTMVGRDCWWGRCSFCSWTTTFTNFRMQKPEKLLDEVGHLIDLGVREIFDDSGAFPAGNWLRRFCEGMVTRGYHKKVIMGCNMIPDTLSQELYDSMGKANFRFVLFGLESAHQTTVERINKKMDVDKVEGSMRMAKQAGLEPHLTCMVGYPWETLEQAQKTVDMTRALFLKGYIDSLQATIVIPYPGTPLYKECRESGWLLTDDWDRFDMREPIMQSPIPEREVMKLTQGIYKSFLSPRFVWRKLKAIRNFDDVKYLVSAGLRVAGHLRDFHEGQVDKPSPVKVVTAKAP